MPRTPGTPQDHVIAPPLATSPLDAPPPALALTEPPALPPNARWRIIATPLGRIGFVLRRSRRKSIGLSIDDDGLMITAPHWATLGQVDDAVAAKARWVLQKLAQRQSRKQQLATADDAWRHDGAFPYFGRRIRLLLAQDTDRARFEGSPFLPGDGDCLHLPLPSHADHLRVRDAVHAWLQQQARIWFEQRLQVFLDRAQVSMRRWRLSSAATRWGSCSSDGNIMLNWRLIHFPHDIIDYVIAHEVAHLRELNHSNAFWREVGRILPGFETSRNALKQYDPDTLPLI